MGGLTIIGVEGGGFGKIIVKLKMIFFIHDSISNSTDFARGLSCEFSSENVDFSNGIDDINGRLKYFCVLLNSYIFLHLTYTKHIDK